MSDIAIESPPPAPKGEVNSPKGDASPPKDIVSPIKEEIITQPDDTEQSREIELGDFPDPKILVAKQYLSQRTLDKFWVVKPEAKASYEPLRNKGVTFLGKLRRQLNLPVKTYNTACVLFHKYHLAYASLNYAYDGRDIVLASLHVACKIEGTIKKIPELLAASYNFGLRPREYQDVPYEVVGEHHTRRILPEEELLLRAMRIDFRRHRHPNALLVKLAKSVEMPKEIAKTAYLMCIDVYLTWAPLKKTRQTIALACLELAPRVHRRLDIVANVVGENAIDLEKWHTSRHDIIETMQDLFDLYNLSKDWTIARPRIGEDAPFMYARIDINKEQREHNIPRFTPPLNDTPAIPTPLIDPLQPEVHLPDELLASLALDPHSQPDMTTSPEIIDFSKDRKDAAPKYVPTLSPSQQMLSPHSPPPPLAVHLHPHSNPTSPAYLQYMHNSPGYLPSPSSPNVSVNVGGGRVVAASATGAEEQAAEQLPRGSRVVFVDEVVCGDDDEMEDGEDEGEGEEQDEQTAGGDGQGEEDEDVRFLLDVQGAREEKKAVREFVKSAVEEVFEEDEDGRWVVAGEDVDVEDVDKGMEVDGPGNGETEGRGFTTWSGGLVAN